MQRCENQYSALSSYFSLYDSDGENKIVRMSDLKAEDLVKFDNSVQSLPNAVSLETAEDWKIFFEANEPPKVQGSDTSALFVYALNRYAADHGIAT